MPEGENALIGDYFKFMKILEQLKEVKREGWVRKGIKNGESVSDHMYRMALMAMTIPLKPRTDENGINKEINRTHAVTLSLVHDLAEAIVGDITPDCGISSEEKHLREEAAMREISKLLPNCPFDLMELFSEYQKGKTAEAQFVKDLDKLEFIFQARSYSEKYGIEMNDFIDCTIPKIKDKDLLKLYLKKQV
jgi:putative hydrolases of HD superfamily